MFSLSYIFRVYRMHIVYIGYIFFIPFLQKDIKLNDNATVSMFMSRDLEYRYFRLDPRIVQCFSDIIYHTNKNLDDSDGMYIVRTHDILWHFSLGFVQHSFKLLNCHQSLFMYNAIIIKAKVLLPQVQVTLTYFGYPVQALWFYCSQNLQIIWLSNISTFSVPDEGYSRNANLISTFLLYVFSVTGN